MKMFLYYAGHTFVNQIKKMFKTWVIVFILICIVFGAAIGIGAGFLAETAERNNGGEEPEPTEEVSEPVDPQRVSDILELAVGGAALAVFLFNILSGEKSGSSIFSMADVNLLFSAPLKPQSVLLFRLVLQMGAMLAASIYLVFQIPNLVLNAGLSLITAVVLLLVWIFMLIVGRLLSVLTYSLASTRPRLKKYVRPVVYAVIFLLAAGFYMKWKSGGLTPFEAALGFFNGRSTWYIPFWGWLKAFAVGAAQGDTVASLLGLFALLAGSVALTYLIWSLKVDFYEDAMARSAETAEKLAAAQADGKGINRRKKDRADRIRRDGLNRGWGASVYFWKSMYNRFRFARFGVFTKTLVTYLLVGVGAVVLLRYVIHYEDFMIAALAFAGIVFFRSLGNPLAEDTKQDTFFMVPDSAHRKVFFSLIAGTANSFLDLLPGYAVAAVALRSDPAFAAASLVLILSVDLYSSAVGAFIDLSLPVSLSKNIRAVVQIMFIYFGLIPLAGIIGYGIAIGQAARFMLIATAFDLVIAGIMFSVTPQYVKNGRK